MCQMEPKETKPPPRKQPRQHPSVPFVWEELPGLPKKNWQPSLAAFVPSPPTLPPPIPVPVKLVTSVPFCWEKTPGKLLLKLPQPPPPETATTTPLPPPVPVPVKLVTSVPFCWEETPGKPAPSTANDPPKLPQPPSKTATTPLLPPPVPVPVKLVTSVPFHWEETPGQPYPCFVDFDPTDPFDRPLTPPPMYGCEAETSSDIYDDASSDSFSFVPISGAFTVDEFDDNLNRETSSIPTSPAYDTDDSTSSYMTGSSFLEKLFPRLPQENSHHVQVTTASNDINFGFPVRTQYTLRELIMMSRRRNYMRKQIPSVEFTKYGAESSCLFELEGSEWKRYQRRM
ncbi:hydroxyproline-rich glycoprotein family protein [Raphanus sativus]|uniref:Extensin-like n=1 Tax=Raphanus sativus TaxID=3726 RepID=A0A9W3CPU0_RAPSA|nr:extensin-like [Raphanus sativus]KAJ4910036.1 hydroxyproline-rich glycoprotein family protein [Raphanus sativus]